MSSSKESLLIFLSVQPNKKGQTKLKCPVMMKVFFSISDCFNNNKVIINEQNLPPTLPILVTFTLRYLNWWFSRNMRY